MQVLIYDLGLVKFVENNQKVHAFYPFDGVYGLIGSAEIVNSDIRTAAAAALIDAAKTAKPYPLAWYNPNSHMIELSATTKKPIYEGPAVCPDNTTLFVVTDEALYSTNQQLPRMIPDSHTTIRAIQAHSLNR